MTTHVEVGANLGAEIERAAAANGTTLAEPQPQPASAPVAKPDTSLVLVGIAMHGDAGRVTLDACDSQTGTLILGPEAGYSGLLSHDAFVRQLKVCEIRLNRFTINQDNGRITRGSLVYDPTGSYSCPNCKAVYRLTPAQLKWLRKNQRRDNPCCYQCTPTLTPAEQVAAQAGQFDPSSRNQLKWHPDEQPTLGAGDPRVVAMYDRFQAYSSDPEGEAGLLVPRVWGVYPADQAPTEWMRAPGDVRAEIIMAREAELGATIRPYPIAEKAGSPALRCLIQEATLDASGKPGLAIGWLSYATLSGRLNEDPNYGYTVRLVSRRRRQHREFTV